MARKRIQASMCESNDGSSSDDTDVEKTDRDDERGRTVLAKVGQAILSGTKIQLDWHPTRNTPWGPNRLTFTRYIGVVVRERVCITYRNWKEVPRSKLDDLYNEIAKGFTVRADRKKWIIARADEYWRNFKTRLRKYWLYKKSGKIRKSPPWKYKCILQPAWDKFIEMSTSEKFQEISEDSRRRSNLKISSYRGGCLGYQHYEDEIVDELVKNGKPVDDVPRHEMWIRAHSRVSKGVATFTNLKDYETAQKIEDLKAKVAKGEIILQGGRDDILARALGPEHGGRVRGIGGGVTNTEYFGYYKSTPPSQMRAELNGLRSEVTMLKNNHLNAMNFMMSILSQDQIMKFKGSFTHMGNLADQGSTQPSYYNAENNNGVIGFVGSGLQVCYNDNNAGKVNDNCNNGVISGQQSQNIEVLGGGNQFCYYDNENINDHNDFGDGDFGRTKGQTNGFFTQLLNSGDDGFVQWSRGQDGFSQCSSMLRNQQQQEEGRTDNLGQINIQEPNSALLAIHMEYGNPITEQALPQGDYDCSLGIEKDKGVKIVASGQVHITGGAEVTLNHFNSLSNEYRRVCITTDLVPTAPLPCPTEECTVVCQAVGGFVSWPAHLIFHKKTIDKQPEFGADSQSPSSQTSISVSTGKRGAYVSTTLLKSLRKEALILKKRHRSLTISIPDNVFYHEHNVMIDHEDLLDWCYQKEIGSAHMAIFMKLLSESCKRDGISGVYGFCDSNYLSPLNPTVEQDRIDYLCRVFGCNEGKNINQLFFAPFHENRHWVLAAISPWNGTVFWLDPAGGDAISTFAQKIINEGIIKFSALYRKDIKKIKKNPVIRWKKIQCPRQNEESKDCGYYVCRYIIETISSRRPFIPDEYIHGIPNGTYPQELIDDLRDMWVKYFFQQIEEH